MAKLAKIKTKATELSVDDFISNIKDEQQRSDSATLVKLMKKATNEKPKIWSNSMIGFGEIIVKSPNTGREVEWLKMGFAPRKANLSLYLSGDIQSYSDDLKKLGKHKTGVGCLYINRLSDVDMKVLEKMINKAGSGKK